jgi:hypothetical protein
VDGVTRNTEVCAARLCAVPLVAVLPVARRTQEHLAQGMRTRSESTQYELMFR